MAASDKKISELTELAVPPAAGDYIEIVDINEALDADKNKRLTITLLFTSPTLVTPTVADLTNMVHDHANAAGGGATLQSPTIVTPTVADLSNMTHDHTSNAQGGILPDLEVVFYENEVVAYENDLVLA